MNYQIEREVGICDYDIVMNSFKQFMLNFLRNKSKPEPIDPLHRLKVWLKFNYYEKVEIYLLGQGLVTDKTNEEYFVNLVDELNINVITQMSTSVVGNFDLINFYIVKATHNDAQGLLIAYLDPAELFDNGYVLAYKEIGEMNFEDISRLKIEE